MRYFAWISLDNPQAHTYNFGSIVLWDVAVSRRAKSHASQFQRRFLTIFACLNCRENIMLDGQLCVDVVTLWMSWMLWML
jgi:hypothetical protein